MIAQRRRGSIINVISTEGHQGNPGNVGYGTAKSGLLNFTRVVAMELAPHGIHVNSLAPTTTDPAEGFAPVPEWGVPWHQPAVERRPDTTWGDQGCRSAGGPAHGTTRARRCSWRLTTPR